MLDLISKLVFVGLSKVAVAPATAALDTDGDGDGELGTYNSLKNGSLFGRGAGLVS